MKKQDLAIVVADKNMDFALRGILSRPKALGIRGIRHRTIPHSGRDGGVRTSGPALLAVQERDFEHGLLLLDFEGSGSILNDAVALEAELDKALVSTWGDRAKAIVIEPELDSWVWGSDNLLRDVLEWKESETIRDWLRSRNFQFSEHGKPERPKEALDQLMRHVHQPRSSSLYQEITHRISLTRCVDPAFRRLKDTLARWFPEVANPPRQAVSPGSLTD
mgnify:CR=1 FL=1